MKLELQNLSFSYGTQEILHDLSFSVAEGEFVSLLGPSGCGKSTLLNAMAGFLKPSSGEIKIDGQTVEKPSMKYVTIFQNYGLLPWRSVQKNVELGLETKKLVKEEKKKITDHYLEMVGLKEAAKKCNIPTGTFYSKARKIRDKNNKCFEKVYFFKLFKSTFDSYIHSSLRLYF